MARRKKTKSRACTPLPEAIGGDSWRVMEGPPCVDLDGRVMFIPTAAGAYEEYARAHEMVHVRITPRDPIPEVVKREKISFDAYNIVEDLRVHKFMKNRGLPTALPENCEEKQLEFVMANADNRRALGGMLIASALTVGQISLERAIMDLVPDGWTIVETAHNIMNRFDNLAVKINMTEKINAIDTVEGFSLLAAPIARLFDQVFPPPGTPAPAGVDPCGYLASNPQDFVPWGELLPVRTAKMPLRRKPRGSGRVWSDAGVVPTAPYRLTVDSRVFARKRRIRGGTVLVDASGSMAFSPAELEAVIDKAPGATVAAYAGRGAKGVLAIMAKDGRMADADSINRALMFTEGGSRLHGNIVDGPALQWLAKQQGPRIWVSDGHVTGVDDCYGLNLMVETNTIVANADIERVLFWREVLEALS